MSKVEPEDNGVLDFGYDVTTSQEAESGLGESNLLHEHGKRPVDMLNDANRRADLKRKNRLLASSQETKRRKNIVAEKKDAACKKYYSAGIVGKLCSGQEKCCNQKCLEVRTYKCFVPYTILSYNQRIALHPSALASHFQCSC